MELETSFYADIPVIKVVGEVDHYSGPAFADVVDRAVSGGGTRIAFDLGGCSYMDSAGMGILLGLAQRFGPDSLVAIIGADDHLRRVLEIVGLALTPSVRFLNSLEGLD